MTTASNTYGFTDPVAQLLFIGDPKDTYLAESWADYPATYGLTEAHLPSLIALANEEATFQHFDSEDPVVYAPIHALQAIGQLKTEAGVEALLKLILRSETDKWDSDWHHERVPSAIALAGERCFAPVEAFLSDQKKTETSRVFLCAVPKYVAKANPKLREQAIAIYRRLLTQYKKQSRWLNATIVGDLVDLKDVDSADLIKEAFEANTVDVSVMGDWEEAFVELGLLDKRLSPVPYENWFAAESEAEEKAREETIQRRKTARFKRTAKAKKQAKRKRKKKRK